MKRAVDIINKVLLYGFFIVAIVLLFVETERVSTLIIAWVSFFASLAFAWLLKVRDVDGTSWLYINIALWLNLIGEIMMYYSGFLFHYDKMIHIMVGVVLAKIVLEYYMKNSILKKDMVFLTVLGMLGLWEIYEYTLDTFFGFQSQGVLRNGIFAQSGFDDTMADLIWGSIGALAYLFFKKEKFGKMFREDIKRIEKISKRLGKKLHFFEFMKDLLKW
jgi:hypothetical protein